MFLYRVGNIECNIPWERPSKAKLLELIKHFDDNFKKAHLFKISLHGAFVSSHYKDTWDIDLKIHYVDISHKNYQDIFDCFYFLYNNALNKYNILVDIKYTDNANSTTNMLYQLINQTDMIKKIVLLDGETIDFTDTHEKKYNDEKWLIKKNIYKKIIKVDGGELFVLNPDLRPITKFRSYVKQGRVYYEDIIIYEGGKINNY